MSQRVSVIQAAKELGMAPQSVREYMKNEPDKMDIGVVLPSIKGEGHRYFIYRDKLDAHMSKKRATQERE